MREISVVHSNKNVLFKKKKNHNHHQIHTNKFIKTVILEFTGLKENFSRHPYAKANQVPIDVEDSRKVSTPSQRERYIYCTKRLLQKTTRLTLT